MNPLSWLWQNGVRLLGLGARMAGVTQGPPAPFIPLPHEPVADTVVCVWCGVRLTEDAKGNVDYFTKPWCTRGDKSVHV